MASDKKNGNVWRIAGLVMCIVFGVILLCNVTIIVKGMIQPDTPPSIFGITPMVVESGSMSGTADGHIEVGDLILSKRVDTDELQEGDVISFMQGDVVITHRIVKIETDADGKRLFTTKGDANNAEDETPVTEDEVIGIYQTRIAGAGDFAMFLQKPLGMLVFIGIPMCAFIIYDIVARQRESRRRQAETSAMAEELEELRKLAGKTGQEDAKTSGE